MKKTYWAAIWKKDKKILALYGMKETEILKEEWEASTGNDGIFTSYMIFETRVEAEKWIGKNRDWEVRKVKITIL